MNLPTPFAYPTSPHQRLHAPQGYRNYQEFKPWLRDEFVFRCVYCLERELWYPNRSDAFGADHIIPQSLNTSRICDYSNLVYACNRCNSAKQAASVLDPVAVSFADNLRVDQDGSIHAITPEGQKLINTLGLDEEPARRVRQYFLLLLQLKRDFPDDPQVHDLFVRAFGYPEDLPDLRRLRPPLENACNGSEKSCHFVRREQGLLAEFY